jgi:hypothetical protein
MLHVMCRLLRGVPLDIAPHLSHMQHVCMKLKKCKKLKKREKIPSSVKSLSSFLSSSMIRLPDAWPTDSLAVKSISEDRREEIEKERRRGKGAGVRGRGEGRRERGEYIYHGRPLPSNQRLYSLLFAATCVFRRLSC